MRSPSLHVWAHIHVSYALPVSQLIHWAHKSQSATAALSPSSPHSVCVCGSGGRGGWGVREMEGDGGGEGLKYFETFKRHLG